MVSSFQKKSCMPNTKMIIYLSLFQIDGKNNKFSKTIYLNMQLCSQLQSKHRTAKKNTIDVHSNAFHRPPSEFFFLYGNKFICVYPSIL